MHAVAAASAASARFRRGSGELHVLVQSLVPDSTRERHRRVVHASNRAGHDDRQGVRRMKRPDVQRREPAQVIALFAISLVAMLAMVGVVVDGGTLYLQRRTAQNAADAAALAGARALQQATTSATIQIGEICKYVQSNSFGVTPTATAYFVNTSGSPLGANLLPSGCPGSTSMPTGSIPTGSSGVRV